jgi:glyoxylate/hydroxypyruvate reductase
MSAFVFVLPTWPTDVWKTAMNKVAPDLDVRIWPKDVGQVEEIKYAAAWLPPANVMKGFPNLKLICSLGAGVDAILSDPTLPQNIPIVRVNSDDLTHRMSEYIVLHVLMHHRQQRRLDENQKNKIWDSFPTHAASALTVGIMGMGVMGADAAQKLAVLGFNVLGWSRTRKRIENVTCYAQEELDEFLSKTDILISLLPATPETDGIINRALIQKLSRKGPFGAPIFINAGRGRQQNEADLITCLNNGELYAATLDVFHKEPLPHDSPLWTHSKVTLTPHVAADSHPETICAYVYKQIRKFESGEPLENVVDAARGY